MAKKMGLVIPEKTQFFSRWAYNYYFTEILRGAIAAANLFEWNIMIHHSGMEEMNEYIQFCEEEQIDGVVCLAPVLCEEDLDLIKQMKTPIIIINGRYPDAVQEGAEKAAEYLLEKGHRKIAIINGDMTTTNANDRDKGYRTALSAAGIELTEEMMQHGTFTEDTGYFQMGNLLSLEDPPTGVLCANDLIAIGALRAIKEKKLKVPKDISLIGFDDLIISSYLSPPLTTVRQPLFHLGKEAVITLMSIIRGEKDSYQEVEIETRLIERLSVGEPKKK